MTTAHHSLRMSLKYSITPTAYGTDDLRRTIILLTNNNAKRLVQVFKQAYRPQIVNKVDAQAKIFKFQ